MFRSRGIKEPTCFDEVLKYPDTMIIYNMYPGKNYQKINRLCHDKITVYYNIMDDIYKIYYADYKTYRENTDILTISDTKFIFKSLVAKIF